MCFKGIKASWSYIDMGQCIQASGVGLDDDKAYNITQQFIVNEYNSGNPSRGSCAARGCAAKEIWHKEVKKVEVSIWDCPGNSS